MYTQLRILHSIKTETEHKRGNIANNSGKTETL